MRNHGLSTSWDLLPIIDAVGVFGRFACGRAKKSLRRVSCPARCTKREGVGATEHSIINGCLPTVLAKTHRTVEALAATAPFIPYGSRTFIGKAVDAYFQRCSVMPPNRHRLDTSDAVLAMVQEAMGWTISAPLSVLKARMSSPRFRCVLLPRSFISFIARISESDVISRQIADSTREALVEHCSQSQQDCAQGCIPDRLFAEAQSPSQGAGLTGALPAGRPHTPNAIHSDNCQNSMMLISLKDL